MTQYTSLFLQEDSVLLWKAVCSSKLLANVDLVLFLNKCDLLEKKLNSGIRLVPFPALLPLLCSPHPWVP